ncbi:MAG: FecR family protein [Bryobacteraceae bacterium]
MTGKRIRGVGSGLLIAASLAICHAQILPSYPEGAAKVISLVGRVSVLREAVPWALNIGDSVPARQVIVTGPDGYAVFQVSDGSTFEVYPNSNVVFRKNPPNWGDLLDMLAGRVRIHIEKWGGKPNPNRVLTPTAVISVRGTTFDVSVNDDDETTLVEVEEGIVDVYHALQPGVTKTLNAGESLHVYRDEPLAQNLVDKGALAQRILRSLADAAFMITNPMHGVSLPGHGTVPPISGQHPGPLPPPGPPPVGTPGSPASAPSNPGATPAPGAPPPPVAPPPPPGGN